MAIRLALFVAYVAVLIALIIVFSRRTEVEEVNRREENEHLAETVTFDNGTNSWTTADQWLYQEFCRYHGWSELRSADEAKALRDAVEGKELDR